MPFLFDLNAPIPSPSKINLGLHVLGRRADGYHDIESIFVAIDLCDEIRIESGDHLLLECHPPMTERIEENLVHKAATTLLHHLGPGKQTPKITLTKRIPAGGGLGGGSGNAATTLLALWQFLTGTSPFTDEAMRVLRPLATSLGSDVPFFLHGGVAYVTGRGEEIASMDIHIPWWIVLVIPSFHSSTQEAYSTLSITGRTEPKRLDLELRKCVDNQQLDGDVFRNDFQEPLSTLYTEISTAVATLENHGAVLASLTGSGSTIYGLFTSAEAARKAQQAIVGAQTYICRPLPPYKELG